MIKEISLRNKNSFEVFQNEPDIKAFFSTKKGASNGYPYNRADVFAENSLQSATPVFPKQVHKTNIAVIDSMPNSPLFIPETDGLITNVKGVLLTTVHADCLPVYLYDTGNKAIGLVHAGWRGTCGGIAPKALALMSDKYGSKPSNVKAYIGPGISLCCFEVGSEVAEEFMGNWDFAEEYVNPDPHGFGKFYIDLKGINSRQLADMGVPYSNIEASTLCTCCNMDIFNSYRGEGGTVFRMGAGICLL